MPSEILSDDFFDEIGDKQAPRSTKMKDLIDARNLATKNPGKWVRVGDEDRFLWKEPSAWASEVNTGKKKCLTEVKDGTFIATYWVNSGVQDEDGRQSYGYAINFRPHEWDD